MITVHASRDGTHIRIGSWAGGSPSNNEDCLSVGITISPTEAVKLIATLQQVVDAMPRVGTPADLGCAAL